MNSIKSILIKRKNSYHMGYHFDTYNFFRTPSFSKPNFNNTLLEASFSRNTIAPIRFK